MIQLDHDAALRLAEAGLSGDVDTFLAELRAAGMPPFLITLAKTKINVEFALGYDDGYEQGYDAGKAAAQVDHDQ